MLLHVTDNVAFDIDNDPRCQDSTAYAGDGWYECDNSQVDTNGDKIELRLVRIYSPNRGDLTITNHSEGDLQHVIPWTEYGPQGGGATAYGVLPSCQGADCPNYMGVRGYVFSLPSNSEISLSFGNALQEPDVLSDLFVMEYSEAQMLPVTEITIREITGTGLMDSNAPCTVSSTHSRAFITPFGPIHGAAGAWYNECNQAWALKFSMQDLIDQSYKGHHVNHGDGGNNGNGNGNDGNIDLTAEPPEPSPWTAQAHPTADRGFRCIVDY